MNFGLIFSSKWLNKLFGTTQFLDAIEAATKTLWQRKNLTANTSGTGLINDLTLNNLEIGKTYRLGGQLSVLSINSSVNSKEMRIDINNGATRINRTGANSGDTGTYISIVGLNTIFTATDTTLTFDMTNVVNTYISGNTLDDTFVILEELPSHEVTTKFN